MKDSLNRGSAELKSAQAAIKQQVNAKDVTFQHFFRNAFIGLLSDLYARLNMPTYMLSTGDQRYWSGELVGKGSSPVGNTPTNSLENAFVDAKNFVQTVPRCVVEVESPRINKQALGMQDTQIRLIATIDSVPVALYSTMRRIPVDFAINVQVFSTDWLTALETYEYLLSKLYQLNMYGFVWAGTMHGASYEFDVSSMDAQHTIAHGKEDIDAVIKLPLTLHLQYPAINSGDNIWAGDDIITDYEHNIDIDGDDSTLDLNITFGGNYDEARISLPSKSGSANAGSAMSDSRLISIVGSSGNVGQAAGGDSNANLASMSDGNAGCQNGACHLEH